MKNTANVITRRVALTGAATAILARPGLIRAQTSSDPIKIGVLNDVAGPYRNVGELGSKVAAEMAVEDIGGSLLGRPVQIMQADIQNKPDLASAKAREWIDAGCSLLLDGAATSSGLAIQEVPRTKPRSSSEMVPSLANSLGNTARRTGSISAPTLTLWQRERGAS